MSAAYDDAIAQAVRCAAGKPSSFLVWQDGETMFVREGGLGPTMTAKLVCIAQRWDAKTVQLRFAGGRSEWVLV